MKYTTQKLTAQEAYAEIDDDVTAPSLLVRAERNGNARAQGILVRHVGYQTGAREYNAGTALYAVTFA